MSIVIFVFSIFFQVGEAKIVLDIGQKVVQYPMAKPYIHDILLSMVLAEVCCYGQQAKTLETPHSYFSIVIHPILILGAFLKCAIAKIAFEKNMVSQGFEALARAQYLLRSQTSLGKLKLLSQVKGPLLLYVKFSS